MTETRGPSANLGRRMSRSDQYARAGPGASEGSHTAATTPLRSKFCGGRAETPLAASAGAKSIPGCSRQEGPGDAPGSKIRRAGLLRITPAMFMCVQCGPRAANRPLRQHRAKVLACHFDSGTLREGFAVSRCGLPCYPCDLVTFKADAKAWSLYHILCGKSRGYGGLTRCGSRIAGWCHGGGARLPRTWGGSEGRGD